MKAMLVIQTANGYAAAPYAGQVPDNFVQDMHIASALKSYSYGDRTVLDALKNHFEPEPPVQLKEAA